MTVFLQEDALDELNETFEVLLTNVSVTATVDDATGVATITDNDDPPGPRLSRFKAVII